MQLLNHLLPATPSGDRLDLNVTVDHTDICYWQTPAARNDTFFCPAPAARFHSAPIASTREPYMPESARIRLGRAPSSDSAHPLRSPFALAVIDLHIDHCR